ncbi:MAG: GTPase domain-containing protein [Gemmataceae bacterium]
MSKTRIAIVAVLFLAPWLFLAAAGSYHLWDRGWLFWAWWPMFASFGLAYLLAWRWTRGRQILPDTAAPPPNYWTDRDKLAWEKVDAKAKSYTAITAEQLGNPRHYANVALDLAEQVAKAYHPGGLTPFDHLTLPEVLACAELASADLDALVQKYVPGSHLVRVQDLRTAKKATEYYRMGQNAMWLGSVLINPLQSGTRWAASRFGLDTLFEKLQGDVMLWFHTAFIHQLGHYLVEMNSGRLKVGVKRYREIIGQQGVPPAEPVTPGPVPSPSPQAVSIAVLGPVKAGKSSLVNALVGQPAAIVDALPVPHVGIRYQVKFADGQPLSLLDTSGYGQDGANETEFAAAAEAARDADLVLFVTSATNPGRKPDVDLLDRLTAWFAERPQLKKPPVLAVVNQIDLLSPKAEWSPPYDWRSGPRPKEANIRECVAAVNEQLGSRVVAAVPVCARMGEASGITEDLVPAMAAQLDDARGAAMLRAFHVEGGAEQFKKLGQQLVEGGKKALGILWDNLKK